MSLKGGLIQQAQVDPTASLSTLSQGVQGGSQFYAPTDRTIIQATIHPYENNWDWISQIGATQLIDANGNNYPITGFYVLAKNAESRGLLLRYDASHGLGNRPTPRRVPESDVYLIFLIPHDTDIKTLKIGAKSQNLDTVLHVQ